MWFGRRQPNRQPSLWDYANSGEAPEIAAVGDRVFLASIDHHPRWRIPHFYFPSGEVRHRDDFVALGTNHPALRASWCMRAYREFEGLYNVTLIALTQDRDREALLAQVSMQGVSHANALALGRRFLEAIEWVPAGTGAAPAGSGS